MTAISWRAGLQKIVVLFSIEVGLIADVEAAKEALYFKWLMYDLGFAYDEV